jgi:hypothetical protein
MEQKQKEHEEWLKLKAMKEAKQKGRNRFVEAHFG